MTSHQVDRTERSRVLSFMPLFIASAAFWGLFQQQFTVVAIYSKESLDATSSAGLWALRHGTW